MGTERNNPIAYGLEYNFCPFGHCLYRIHGKGTLCVGEVQLLILNFDLKSNAIYKDKICLDNIPA